MTKKHKLFGDIVYSTNPDYKPENAGNEETVSLMPQQQNLRVMRENKNRGGKTVTIVTGFTGKEDDLKDLGKILKTKCGVGGTVKDSEIIIQGDVKEKVYRLLLEMNYKVKMAGG